MHLKSLFSIGPLLVAVLMMVAAPTHADTPTPVDRSFTYKMDILANAAPADVVLRVTGSSIRAPFNWSVTIKDADGRVVGTIDVRLAC